MKENIQGVCLLCLCVGSMSLISPHEEVPKYCAKAKKCTPCLHQSCTDKNYKDMFRLMCCGSEAANKTQECRQLCENSSCTNAVRYNSKKNESEDLCPANQMLKECEKDYNTNCTEKMCTHFVLKKVFLQQCHAECKNLATGNLNSSITSSTKSLNETTKSTEDPSDKALINSEQQVGLSHVGDEVFIFYRGTTSKNTENSTGKTFSWVAKVCKKSGDDCSLSVSDPTFFNGIYEVSRSDDLYFNISQGEGEDQNRSAIFTFNKANIEASFQEQDQDYSDLDNCTGSTSTVQWIKVNITSMFVIPLFSYDVVYRKIAVSAEFMGSRNIYVATDKGRIFQMFMKTFEKGNPPVVWNNMSKLFDMETPIQSIKLEGGTLFIATDLYNKTLDLDNECQNFTEAVGPCIYNLRCFWCQTTKTCFANSSSDSTCTIRLDSRNVNEKLGICIPDDPAGTTNTTVLTGDDVKPEITTPANPPTTKHDNIIVKIMVPVVIVIVIVIAVLAKVYCCKRPCDTNSDNSETAVNGGGVPESAERSHLQESEEEDKKSSDEEDGLSEIRVDSRENIICMLKKKVPVPNLQY